MALALGYIGGLGMGLVGFLMIAASGAEARQVLLTAALAGLRVRDILPPSPVAAIHSWQTVRAFLDGEGPGAVRAGLAGSAATAFPLRDFDGGLAGVLTLSQLAALPAGRRETARLSEVATPLLVLIIAIAVTDLAFAFDSIPAIFGLTRDPYLVFTANVFALLGLRHLYFLIGGLFGRVPHLSAGLSAILGFIGVKLITEALLESGVHQIGPVPVPHIGTGLSLAIIAAVITTVTLTSLLAAGRRSRPETFNLPDGSRRLRTQRGCAGVSGRRLLTSWGSRAG